MRWPSRLSIKKPCFTDFAAIILTLSLVFLQEGFTYYISFQLLALVTVGLLILSAVPAIKLKMHFFVAFLAFLFFLAITAVVSPAVISRNSSNIFVTVIGVSGYAVMIGCIPNLKMKRADLILRVLKSVSSAIIIVLAGLIVVSESGLIPFLTRDSLLTQNSRLIDNYTDADALLANAALRLLTNQSERIDLFYGEPSFLAIVLFTCLGCFILTSNILADASKSRKPTYIKTNFTWRELVILFGVMSLLYVESFSSIIYALIVVYFSFIKGRVARANLLTSIALLIVIASAFAVFSYEYFLFRLTQSDSVSLVQRFGFLSDLGIGELLLGLKDESTLPSVGIHNGLFYIIAIAGFGGILFIASLLYSVYSLSTPIKSYSFCVLLLLAIIMQNGAVFSPSKVVLISLVLVPLACARSIYPRQHPPATDSRCIAGHELSTMVEGHRLS